MCRGNKQEGGKLMFKKLRNLFKKSDKNQVAEKDGASARGEPYVKVINVSFDKNKPSDGYFELDWNQHFIKKLMDAGYTGSSEEEIIDAWFTQLCRNIGDQES
jgi:hypothetical protein